MDVLAALFVKMLLRAAFGSLIGAVFVRAAASWVEKQELDYWKAYGLYFVNYVVVMSIVLLVGFASGLIAFVSGLELSIPALLTFAFLMGMPLSGLVMCLGLSISYGRAMLVTLVTFGLSLLVFGGIGLAIWSAG